MLVGRIKGSLVSWMKPRRARPGAIVREFTACQGSEDAPKETGTQAEGRKCQAQVHRRCYVLSVAGVPGHRGGGGHFRWSKEHQMCGVEVSSDLAPL